MTVSSNKKATILLWLLLSSISPLNSGVAITMGSPWQDQITTMTLLSPEQSNQWQGQLSDKNNLIASLTSVIPDTCNKTYLVHNVALSDSSTIQTLSTDSNMESETINFSSDVDGVPVTQNNREQPSGSNRVSIINMGMISKSQCNTIEYVLDKCVTPVISVLGIMGNVISLRVFFHPHMVIQYSTKVYMRTLCFMDLIYLVLGLTTQIITFTVHFNPTIISKVESYLTPYVDRTLIPMAGASSTLLVVIVSIERFLVICFPLKSCDLKYIPRALSQVITVLVFSFAFFIPNYLRYKFVKYYNPDYDTMMWKVEDTQFYHVHNRKYTVWATTANVLFRVVPTVIVLTCNLATILGLWLAARARSRMVHGAQLNSLKTVEVTLTRMLLTLATMFLICIMPLCITTLISRFLPTFYFYKREHYLFTSLIYIGTVTRRFSSAINVVIFTVCNARFREILLRLLYIKKPAQAWNSQDTDTKVSQIPETSFN